MPDPQPAGAVEVIQPQKEVLTFRRSVPDPDQAETFLVEIEFKHEADGREETKTFEVYDKAYAGASLALSSFVRYDQRGRQIVDLNGMMRYFERVMPPADYKQFETLVEDESYRIDMEFLAEVFNGVLERHSGRPTRQSSGSSVGPRRTGRHSTARRS